VSVRVLLVDGNPDYRFLVGAALRRSTLQVVAEVDDAEAAIAAATTAAPDLVVVDPVLPDASPALVSQLRAVAPDAVIVIVSAYPEEEVWVDPTRDAATFFLPKSAPAPRLAELLLAFLERAAAARSGTGADVVDEASTTFPPEARSASDARRFARETLARWACPEAASEAVVLLVSELVTNAIIHAKTTVDVQLSLLSGHLRVEVVDRAPEYIRRRAAADEDQSGRGMALIDTLTTGWGIDERPDGKAVWFEVSTGVAA
jgi:DNA-binding NarL/FixJ family response regulator